MQNAVLEAMLDSLYTSLLATSAVAFSRSIGIEPDPWQAELLSSPAKCVQVNCSRQSGKTTTVGTIAAHQAIYSPGSQTIILARAQRQGIELSRKVYRAYLRAGKPVAARVENQFELLLENDSRVLVLPGSEATSRGPGGIDLLLVEEASRVPDELYYAVLPMLATRPQAREIQMSTPFGTRGFFWERWRLIQSGQAPGWQYFEIPAQMCPRISAEFLEEMRRRMGSWWFSQEFGCQFLDAQTQAFQRALIDRAFAEEVEQWSL